VTGSSDTVSVGGLVVRLARGALIEYSSASGTLSWEPTDGPGTSTQYYGGLVALSGNDENGLGTSLPRTTEIRDSYSRVSVKWPDGAKCKANFGGIVGATNQIAGDIYLVRSYSASNVDSSTDTSSCGAPFYFPQIGGLIGDGRLDRLGSYTPPDVATPTYIYFVSSFWAEDLLGNVSDSIGYPTSGSTNQYVSSLPRAVGLTSGYLKTLSTFQSKESGTTGIPDVSSNLAEGSSAGGYTTDGTLNTNEETFRWAIEAGNVEAFVASSYPTRQPNPPLGAFFNRTLISDTTVPASMAGRGQAALEGPVTGYPSLGRVWEICPESNSGFPVLVWEEWDCSTGGGNGAAGSSSSSPTPSTSASANPGGLSDAEYAEYLASGLTLEQFLAARLAATGVPSSALSLGFGAMLAFLGLGVALTWVTRRERVAGRL
jgi:hypothetical protein